MKFNLFKLRDIECIDWKFNNQVFLFLIKNFVKMIKASEKVEKRLSETQISDDCFFISTHGRT